MRSTRLARAVMTHCLAACLGLLPAAGTGCDREAASAPSSAAAATAPRPPADPYARYSEQVRPLADELTRMRLLLATSDGVKRPEFSRQFREVQFHHAKVAPALTDEDRTRTSWTHLSAAMGVLAEVGEGLERMDAIKAEADAMEPPRRDPQTGVAPPDFGKARRIIELTTELSILPDQIGKTVGQAGREIYLMEQQLAARN